MAGFPATLTGLWLVDRTQQSRTSKSLVSVATIALASLISFVAYQYFTSEESVRDAASAAAPQARESDQVVAVLPDDRPAIAVLPFNNLSPDPEQAFSSCPREVRTRMMRATTPTAADTKQIIRPNPAISK